mmetsp:Transcript_27088/g.58322  ORF Transcript_27088/g.58322 Transcript_27088/m.58322 type:complete len:189 (-) Transcript_27088:267-833(-)
MRDEEWQGMSTKQRVLDVVFNYDLQESMMPRYAYWLPDAGSNSSTISLSSLSSSSSISNDNTGPLFHRDAKGKTCFTISEARRAKQRIVDMGLDSLVKAQLQKRRFVLPQESHTSETNFCNESVYGRMNLLWLTGVVKLEHEEDGEDSDGNTALGDGDDEPVWPAPGVLAADAVLVEQRIVECREENM